jgi:hypothetical protein
MEITHEIDQINSFCILDRHRCQRLPRWDFILFGRNCARDVPIDHHRQTSGCLHRSNVSTTSSGTEQYYAFTSSIVCAVNCNSLCSYIFTCRSLPRIPPSWLLQQPSHQISKMCSLERMGFITKHHKACYLTLLHRVRSCGLVVTILA